MDDADGWWATPLESAPRGAGRWRLIPDGLWTLRDRLLSDRRFLRLALALPGARAIARRRARALFDLCAGFVYSQILLACVRTRLFDVLRDGPAGIDELATALGMSPAATARLLDAAAALDLVAARRGRRYGLGPLGAALLANPGLGAMIEHHALLYRDLADPVALLRGEARGTALARFWPYADDATRPHADADAVADYSTLMAATMPMIVDEVIAGFDFGRHACLLDVGGGEGAFIGAVAAHAPHLRLMLFDVPPVAARAAAAFERAGLAARATAHGGDFLADALPTGADVVTLVRVVHDQDDAGARRLLRAVHAALPRGGALVIAEPMADTPGAEAMGAAYFGFYLLAMGRGRARSRQELTALLSEAGFVDVAAIPTRIPLVTGVLAARVS